MFADRISRVWKAAAAAGVLPVVSGGCAQTVNVAGVYFPGWLVAAVIGVAVSYGTTSWLSSRPRYRALGQSGLFFLSIMAIVAWGIWWVFFSQVLV